MTEQTTPPADETVPDAAPAAEPPVAPEPEPEAAADETVPDTAEEAPQAAAEEPLSPDTVVGDPEHVLVHPETGRTVDIRLDPAGTVAVVDPASPEAGHICQACGQPVGGNSDIHINRYGQAVVVHTNCPALQDGSAVAAPTPGNEAATAEASVPGTPLYDPYSVTAVPGTGEIDTENVQAQNQEVASKAEPAPAEAPPAEEPVL